MTGQRDKFNNLMFEQRVVRGNTYSSNIIKKPELMKVGQKQVPQITMKKRAVRLPSVGGSTVL